MLLEQRERVAAGRMVSRALDERGRVGRQDVRLRKRNAVDGRHDHGCRQRREGQVGGAEAVAAQVLAAVRQQLGDEVELAPDGSLVLDLDPRANAELAFRPAHDHRPPEAERAILPGRHALVVEAQHQLALREHVRVHEPPARRPEPLVEAPAKRSTSARSAGSAGNSRCSGGVRSSTQARMASDSPSTPSGVTSTGTVVPPPARRAAMRWMP